MDLIMQRRKTIKEFEPMETRTKTSEKDQEVPQSLTADQPMTPWEELQNTDCHKTVEVKIQALSLSLSLSLPRQDDGKLERHTLLITKTRTKLNTEIHKQWEQH